MTRSGYGIVPCTLLDNPEVSIYAKIVHGVLSSYAGLPEIKPSHKTIAEKASCSERKVRDALNELKALEMIEWRTVPTETGKISIYRLLSPWTQMEGPAPRTTSGGVRQEMPDRSGTEGGGGPAPGAGDITTEVTKTPSVSSAQRGTRLDRDWVPSTESRSKILADFPRLDLRLEHDRFVDYWIDIPGAKGRKIDWNGTWRNWMRRAGSDLGGASRPNLRPVPARKVHREERDLTPEEMTW